jgi:hypothetical protein
MKNDNLSLSAYAFGYGCGFIHDERNEASGFEKMNLEDLNTISIKYELGGVEIPIDKYFGGEQFKELEPYILRLKSLNLKLVFALEVFKADFFEKIGPLVKRYGSSFVRVKICNFYGGNRFNVPAYKTDLETFRQEMILAVEQIDQYGIKILIENHQDVTLEDIFDLVKEFGANRIGVNWDTGNSFPTGETVQSFLTKTKHLIGNVHLKDYKVQLTPNGYVMHRCTLGKGIVDFEYLISELLDHDSKIPFTIELGAMNGREAFVNQQIYWEYTNGITTEDRKNLIDFITLNAENDSILSSPWERKESPKDILEYEMREVIDSIVYIKELLLKHENN